MKLLLSTFLFLTSTLLFAQGNDFNQDVSRTVIYNGVGLGAVIAVVTSWSRNNSVAWAILHGILSWLYVIYFVVTRKEPTSAE